MDFEEDFWKLVKDRGHVANFYRAECEALWRTFSEEQQQGICDAIQRKIDAGLFVSYRPIDAMRDNVPQQTRQLVWSADQYFDNYRTTEPMDGWQRVFLPDQQKTIYVKN